MKIFLLLTSASLLLLGSAVAQQAPSQTSPAATDEHFAGVNARGDHGMGFSHSMTGHHFHLLPEGGSIEVEAKDVTDKASQEAIRNHLSTIAGMFAEGNFTLPMFIHATQPPGVEIMQRLKSEIAYSAENTAKGAQVKITTKNAQALAAIHEFLRFQITDHRTGDPLEVQRTP